MADERALGLTFTLDSLGFIDFESRGPNVKVCGAYGHAVAADALILSYAIGNAVPATIAVPRFPRTLHWSDLPDELYRFHARVEAGAARWVAWNASFDKAIWNYAAQDFPLMKPRHIIDAMAQASASGLPPDLASAARACGAAVQKDTAGKALIKLFCTPEGTATPSTNPVQWMQFRAYAGADVAAMRDVFRRTVQLPLAEWEEYWAMEAVNERGARIDMELAHAAAALATHDRAASGEQLRALTAGQVTSVDQVKRMVGWVMPILPPAGRAELTSREEELGDDGELVRPAKLSLTRSRIEKLLAYLNALPAAEATPAIKDAITLLQLRYYGGAKTPAKFAKAVAQQIDGVLYGQYVFNGAGQTGRASSRGVQVHNLARDFLPYELDAIEAITGGCSYEALAGLGDATPVARKLSLLVRPLFVAAQGNLFVWSDWSQIEARILPWLAGGPGAEKRLQVFRDVDLDPSIPDIYTRTAADISHLPIAEITKALRQRGKVTELACGFGGGLGALQAMGAGYGLHVDTEEGREIVARWRAANAWCVQFWGKHSSHEGTYGLWGAANRALENPGVGFKIGRVLYIFLKHYLGGTLLCRLPSGRMLTYRGIRYERVAILDDDDNVVGYENVLRFSRGYGRVKLWHGMFCENIVQAVAADYLRGTLRRLGDMGAPVRLHTHDEVLLEVPEGDVEYWRRELRRVMLMPFSWSDGLPLMSEETVASYYTKQETAYHDRAPAERPALLPEPHRDLFIRA